MHLTDVPELKNCWPATWHPNGSPIWLIASIKVSLVLKIGPWEITSALELEATGAKGFRSPRDLDWPTPEFIKVTRSVVPLQTFAIGEIIGSQNPTSCMVWEQWEVETPESQIRKYNSCCSVVVHCWNSAQGVYCVIWREHSFYLIVLTHLCFPVRPLPLLYYLLSYLIDGNTAWLSNWWLHFHCHYVLIPALLAPPGGFFFAKPMRENKYVTMMDPFQQKYGNVMSSALILPALVADVLWVARTLVSLGKLLHTVKLSGTVMCAHRYLCNHAGTDRSRYTMYKKTLKEKQWCQRGCCNKGTHDKITTA